ncbi:Putative Iron transport multicopper oxidase FET3 [[Torrubiella] hemipterigena]|uniref:Putative Iron transport multicopper oxidase FET3 n=1 Tax=[Torrubiella] hemipterigena TaxID=1531966 RepID=A0A0A1TA48_9HYPO|nr:Putative Iron transport multicopper oxidase FET3 [[Torrubiella] hemipterigena]
MAVLRASWLAAAFALPWLAQAETVVHDFNITWVRANPDGMFERPVIGINGKWPIPTINVTLGDRVVINVNNQLGNQSTSLHFHGLFMNGTNQMDGPSGATQCPIPVGSSFTYNFTVEQPGTYWYHSHTNAQYPDGLRAPFIVNDPKSPYNGKYDHEQVLTLSDWYHDEMQDMIPVFMSKVNPSGAEPVPDSSLINEQRDLQLSVEPGKTYLFRTINIGAFASQYLWIEGHKMQVVEVDGVYTEAAETDMIFIAAAQRVSFLVTTKNTTDANFPIVAAMDTTLFDQTDPDADYNVTGWFTYDKTKDLPKPTLLDEFKPLDDMTLVPFDHQERLPEPDRIVELDVIMKNQKNGANYAFFSNITYTMPKVPTLYTVMSAGDLATNPEVYGTYTHPFVLKKGEIVQIVVNNLDSGRHPFHLHGHHFQAVYRSEEEAGTFADLNVTEDSLSKTPMRRDTMVVWPQGNIVLRFRADNPGVWLFHCHIEWHVVSGLLATFIESPLDIQKQAAISKDHLAACEAGGIPTKGNAAANSANFLDLTGENTPPGDLPDGFTSRGIVAFVFSWITGILGVCVVAWYGLSQPKSAAYSRPIEIVEVANQENDGVAATNEGAVLTTGAETSQRS